MEFHFLLSHSHHHRTITMTAASASASASVLRAKPKPGPKPSPPGNKWRTSTQEQAYRSRLLEALRAASSRRASGPRAVKQAADSALALTGRGQSRWSRAILLSRPGGRLLVKHRPRRQGRPRPAAAPPPRKGERVGDRLRALGRLVPGCLKLSAPSLLEEAADYVAALEMQVKAMRALADALSAAAAGAEAEGGSRES